MADGMAAQGVSTLANDAGADLAQSSSRKNQLSGHRLLLRAEEKGDAPKSLEEVDPKLLETYEKLGIPLHEREQLAGVAVDAVFDSVSVGTTFKKQLAEKGIIFCSFSEAVQEHPDLVANISASVVPYTTIFLPH